MGTGRLVTPGCSLALRRSAAVIGLMAVAAGVAGCRGEKQGASRVAGEQLITVAGAGASLTLLQQLVPAFNARHPGITIAFFPESHTAGGVDSVLGRGADIGAVARQLHPNETGTELMTCYFATDPVAFVIHPSTGISGLTSRQIRSAFSGEVTDWLAFGGKGTVVVIDRPLTAASWEVLSNNVFAPPFKPAEKRVIIDRSSDTMKAVSETVGAISYCSFGVAQTVKAAVGILAVDGVRPSAETIRDGSYPFKRALGIVYRRDAPASVKALADFLGTEEAEKFIRKSGFIP